jgi:hypothetical protein
VVGENVETVEGNGSGLHVNQLKDESEVWKRRSLRSTLDSRLWVNFAPRAGRENASR